MSRGLPSARFVVLAKRPGHVPVARTGLMTEENAHAYMNHLLNDPAVRSMQYAVAELQLTGETYR